MWALARNPFRHCGRWPRRAVLQAGVLGLTEALLPRLQANGPRLGRGKAEGCVFVFLTGGPSQRDTFDMKPAAPSGVRGPYKPIATTVPGLSICEKLPLLARRM